MGVRTKLVVSAVLAFSALALIPAIGRAETSSEINYGGHLPELRSVPPVEHPRSAAPKGHHPKHAAPASTESPAPAVEPEASEGRHPAAVAPSGGDRPPPGSAGGHGPRRAHPHQAHPPTASRGSDRKPVSNFSPAPTGQSPNQIDSSGNGGGGSSPVVPLLIAIAALAALSIGVVVYRERQPLRR